MGISFLPCRSMHKHQGLSIYPTSFQWGFQWDLKTTTIVGASFCRTISSVIGFSMILSGWIGIHQYTHQPDIFRHGADPPSYPSLVIWLFLFFITLLSCRRLEWISLFLATYFYHMNPEPTSMEPQNAQCGRSSRSSPRDPRGSFGGLKPSKLPKAVPGTCNVATSKNSQLAMDQNSLAHNSLYIYIVSNHPFCRVIILNHTHMGFWLTTWGLVVVCWSRSFVFVVKSKPSTLKKSKNQSVWQTTGTRSSKFFKLVQTRDKKILVISDLGLDNLVDISQKIGHKRHRIGSPCEVPSAFNVSNHSPIQEQPRRASSLHTTST